MPLLPIITMILSFFLAKKQGLSNGKAALVAAGTGAASYAFTRYTDTGRKWENGVRDFFGMSKYDPEHRLPSSVKDFRGDEAAQAAAAGVNERNAGSAGGGGWETLGALGTTALNGVTDVAKSWGPAGVVGAAAGAKVVKDSKGNTLLLIGGAALVALFLMR